MKNVPSLAQLSSHTALISWSFLLAVFCCCGWGSLAQAREGVETSSVPISAEGEIKAGDFTVLLHNFLQRELPTTVFKTRSEKQKKLIEEIYPSGIISNSFHVLSLRGKDKEGNSVLTLVDTGYTHTLPQLAENLGKAGISFEDVTHVIITHTHGDHMGGLAENGKATFPNARLIFSAPGHNFWSDTANRSSVANRDMQVFEEWALRVGPYGDKVYLANKNGLEEEVLPGVVLVPIPGHTPGQIGVLIRGAQVSMQGQTVERSLFFWADLMHGSLAQLKDPDISVTYDRDPLMAAQTRKMLLRRAKDEGWLLSGSHMSDSRWFSLQ